LAHRALEPVFPSAQEYKYVVRCSSDVLESNGSSSMATVCGATLSMLDAGVPLKAPVAGIAMGLIKLDDNYVVLSDILGDEDHLGDMDFKVTGTPNGITAFQMDTKLGSIPREVMNKAMTQAKEGRMHILGKMAEVIDAPRQELSPFAPRITSIQIKPDKIRDVIGKGGVVIKEIQSTCDVRVSIEDSGQVDVISTNADNAKRAIEWIEGIVREPELNELYMSKVIGLKDFGVIVELFPGNEMLLHISEWDNTRTASLEGLVNVGDEILIKVINGRKGLTASRKAAFGESV